MGLVEPGQAVKGLRCAAPPRPAAAVLPPYRMQVHVVPQVSRPPVRRAAGLAGAGAVH